MHRARCYRFLSTAIGVVSDEPGLLAWLDEFLAPAFEIGPGGPADFSVAIRVDGAAHARARATRPAGPLAAAACFANDQEVKHYAAWRSGGSRLLEDADAGLVYRLSGTQIDVLAEPHGERRRPAAMRVVREIATARALASPGRLQLHAAAVEADGRALLIAGPKRAGKTTLLGYLAASGGARILTNDRVILSRTDGGVDARGMPTIVSIRPDTLRLLPVSFDAVSRIRRPFQLTLAEADAARQDSDGLAADARLGLSPAQLARQLGVALVAHARLGAIAFPERHPDPEGLAIDRLDPPRAAPRLLGARFGLGSGRDGPTVFEELVGSAGPAGGDESLLARVVEIVPCFAVRLGARRFARPEAARQVLSTCLHT